jgi:DNA-binding MarR family transcriptional regulator
MSTVRRATAIPTTAAERLDEGLGFIVRKSYRAMVRALARELQPHRVSAAEWSVLRVLWREQGMSQVELAERMRVERGSLTKVLAGLEARGLLVRVRDGEDGRKVKLDLTPAGQALEPVLLQCGLAANERAMRGMVPREVEATRKLLELLVANLED